MFKPEDTKVAIVSCGGLCPGINVVINSLVQSLSFEYNVKEIYGIKWGYRGFYEEYPKYWVELDEEMVHDIQSIGGTILGSSRGGFDAEKMIEALQDKGIT